MIIMGCSRSSVELVGDGIEQGLAVDRQVCLRNQSRGRHCMGLCSGLGPSVEQPCGVELDPLPGSGQVLGSDHHPVCPEQLVSGLVTIDAGRRGVYVKRFLQGNDLEFGYIGADRVGDGPTDSP